MLRLAKFVHRSLSSIELLEDRIVLSSGTGLDQLVNIINNDPGLIRRISADQIAGGAAAADAMNQIIVTAIKTTGVANDGTLNMADVRDLNAYIRANYLEEWTELHGDDENGVETGFHLVQGDGATTKLFGKNAVNTVADGIYHLGFVIENNRFLNEDGNANASVETVTFWLGQLLESDLASGSLVNPEVDPYARGSTNTGLDQLINIIAVDPGLNRRISTSQITAGARAADAMNQIIITAIKATGVANDGTLNMADVRDINSYIRANYLQEWITFHGDDEDCVETGFHLVQNDGATTRLFGKNAVDTVADGLYHLGFEIKDNRFLNEDGNANASVETVTFWLGQLLESDLASGSLVNPEVDPYARGSTNTGLDQLINIIAVDPGLNRRISTSQITAGARAADAMNQIIITAIKATGVANDGSLNVADVRDLNAYIRANYLQEWTALHGDDENGVETGFHLVQDDGATTRLFAKNAVNTVADGLYHLGFEIQCGRFLNEDGNANASLESVTFWLNQLLQTDLQAGTLANSGVDPYAHGTTGTGLDLLVNLIAADEGLNRRISTSEITAGARAADRMNQLIIEAIKATGVANDGNLSEQDVRDLNAYLRANHLAEWTALHGDDEEGVETGFHLVQNDGATSRLFNKNAVNTVADGLYHLGFEIKCDRFVNEDGDANASVRTVATWLNQLLATELANGSLNGPSR